MLQEKNNNSNNSLLKYQEDLVNKIKENEKNDTFLSFYLSDKDEEGYIIKLSDILKIGKIEKYSKLGICKDWFLGIINVENNIATLIDFYVLNKEKNKKVNLNQVILLKENKYFSLALACDRINFIVNKSDLVLMNAEIKDNFIRNEYLQSSTGIILKEIEVELLFKYEDLKNVFNEF